MTREPVGMVDVIAFLSIDTKMVGKNEFAAYCPHCGKTEGRRTLNINPVKEYFHCFRCDVSGRTADLYCLFVGWGFSKENRIRAFEDLRNSKSLGVDYNACYETTNTLESSLATIDVRHKTYSILLAELDLSCEHKMNLINRGLAENEIKRLGYKTSPTKNLNQLCEKLIEKGCTLEGVPGFYKDAVGKWSVAGANERGILIPFKDEQGRIQGLHKRLDNAENGKFRWFSSGGYTEGTKAESWIHFVGEIENRSVIITEGAMKADIISAINGGQAVLAIPGVNAIQKLETVLLALKNNKGINCVKTAFDMDYLTNEQVEKAYNNLFKLLQTLEIKYSKQIWPPCYKGYDDYLALLYRGV